MPEPPNDREERAGDRPAAAAGRPLDEWRGVWEGNVQLELAPPPGGLLGRLKAAVKRRVRRWTGGAQADLWERQRLYNLELQAGLERTAELAAAVPALAGAVEGLRRDVERLGADLQEVQRELVRDIRWTRETQESELEAVQQEVFKYLKSHAERLDFLEGLKNEGFDDLRRHTDALFARVDHKLDHYRRRSRELWSQLGSLLARAEGEGAAALVRGSQEQGYVELERCFRGVESEIERRIEPYLEFLRGRGDVLDLGCGRGEALELMAGAGITCRGVDSNEEMVARCREKGLEAVAGDLFEALSAVPAGSLGGVVSFHVIEHLPAGSLDRLARLAWSALAPGGVLILETPNPLSLVVAARNFWLDPTHLRPVHPATLELGLQLAGFDPVQRIDLQPFAEEDRLPQIDAGSVSEELRPLTLELNRLRDELDRLLFGFQDYGMVGIKPDAAD